MGGGRWFLTAMHHPTPDVAAPNAAAAPRHVHGQQRETPFLVVSVLQRPAASLLRSSSSTVALMRTATAGPDCSEKLTTPQVQKAATKPAAARRLSTSDFVERAKNRTVRSACICRACASLTNRNAWRKECLLWIVSFQLCGT